MIINVRMLAFGEIGMGCCGLLRPVNIPDSDISDKSDNILLYFVFHWGQNDFQPSDRFYSVSVGDVVHLRDTFYLCMPIGWHRLTNEEYIRYESLNCRDRRDMVDFLEEQDKAIANPEFLAALENIQRIKYET